MHPMRVRYRKRIADQIRALRKQNNHRAAKIELNVAKENDEFVRRQLGEKR